MLSIIIPTLNEEKNLPAILKNIKEQDFNINYEIIVSDANSKDKTQEIAKEKGCLLVGSLIKSPAHQRNQGAKLAQGDTLLFLDADSKIPTNFLKLAYQEFKNRQLVCAGLPLKFNTNKPIYKIYNKLYKLACSLTQYYKPLAVGAAIISEQAAHNKIKGFDETVLIGEDHDYAKRIKKIGKFRMIKSTYFYFSPRRWEKEGHLTTIFKILKMLVYTIFKGPIRKKIVKYDFGHY